MKRGHLTIRTARRDELPTILAIQHDAFGRVAAEYGIARHHLPPLTETVSDLEALYDAGTHFYIAITGTGQACGAVRHTQHGGTVEIGRLVVDANHLRQGVGTRLMMALEGDCQEADEFQLFTGAAALSALAFYERLGYTEVRRDSTGAVDLVWLGKKGQAG